MLSPAVFKAYDVRGIVPEQVDEELARRTGMAFVSVLGAETVAVGQIDPDRIQRRLDARRARRRDDRGAGVGQLRLAAAPHHVDVEGEVAERDASTKKTQSQGDVALSGPRPRSPDSSRRAISDTSRATERANQDRATAS